MTIPCGDGRCIIYIYYRKNQDAKRQHETSWAAEEFAEVNLGDKRLDARLIKLCDRFSDAPESPINQACVDWAETKAAYRFFQNDNVGVAQILAAHCRKTAQRAREHKTILALQDTSYFVYTSHPKTKGLGKMSLKKGKNVKKIFSRKLRTKKTRKAKPHDHLPIEEKESYRWLEALENTKAVVDDTETVTVCDREADLYDFFKCGYQIGAPVLVRANTNRTINRNSRYAEKSVEKLWEHMSQQSETGSYTIEIPKRSKRKHCEQREARTATVTVRYATFILNPPRNNIKHSTEELPNIEMHAVYVLEPNPPDGAEPVEWMLLTNLPVTSYEDACEKVQWYCLHWRIEMYFKVLKSGFRVEACRPLGKISHRYEHCGLAAVHDYSDRPNRSGDALF